MTKLLTRRKPTVSEVITAFSSDFANYAADASSKPIFTAPKASAQVPQVERRKQL